MIEINTPTLVKLGELIAADGGPDSGVRIAPMGGSTGPVLGLIVDEPSDNDVIVQESGVLIIVDRNLMDYCKTITVEFKTGHQGSCGGSSGSGFVITPEEPINL